MVQLAQYVELSLRVVLEAWLQGDRFHRKLDLVIVFLLYELDDAKLAGAEAVTSAVQMVDFFRFQDAC